MNNNQRSEATSLMSNKAVYGSDEESGKLHGPSSTFSETPTPSCCGDIGKSIVFGSFDGLLFTIVVISISQGANLSAVLVVALCIAGAFASGISVGASEFISSKSHREFIRAEKRRELWEFKHYRDSEVHEMINRFELRGVARRDAENIVGKLAQYENLFVSLMVAEDLGLQLPEENDAVMIGDAAAMFLSYLVTSMCPVGIFGICTSFLSSTESYFVAIVIALIMLCALGIVKSSFSSSNWVCSASESLLLGCLCAGVAFTISHMVISLLL